MPVDPLEEARERLRRWASDLERRAADHSMGTCDPTYEGPTRGDRAVMVNQAALFRTILAELDRRTPPEQSAAGHPVAVDGGRQAEVAKAAEPNTSNIKDQTHG